jgi:tripartite-type tricarboxylate transporter receptor subunit TctC
MHDTLVGSAPLLKAGRVRALAVTGPKGSSSLPGIPTVADTYPNLAFESWLGVAAPVGTPPAVIARLNKELQTIMGTPDIRQRLLDWGANPQASTSADFKARIERDILGLKRVVAERQIQMD